MVTSGSSSRTAAAAGTASGWIVGKGLRLARQRRVASSTSQGQGSPAPDPGPKIVVTLRQPMTAARHCLSGRQEARRGIPRRSVTAICHRQAAHSRRYACLPALRGYRWSSQCVTGILRGRPSFPSGHGPDDLACDLDGGVVKVRQDDPRGNWHIGSDLVGPARRCEGYVTVGPAGPAIQRPVIERVAALTMIPRIAGPSCERRTPSPATAVPMSARRPARSALAVHTHGQVVWVKESARRRSSSH